ncbi:hypothetical protein Q8A67_012599 [Cirrhinus molitorella]|uniref:Uncharacterized protein n=1 Tax=Cirrhinus molitorella TaxID=172907 RepID=A0AA88PJU1_9TELE|nr:hypothetical protein Q8A67_012599 [Cirrhinus molitorella]
MSFSASNAKELSGSSLRILSKAVKELDLEWSPPEEPSRSLLDEWFLPGRARPLVRDLRCSFQKSTTISPICVAPPTRRASALPLPQRSPLSTAPKRRF